MKSVPELPPTRRLPLVISKSRKGTLSAGMIDLELTLSEIPDAVWIERFERGDPPLLAFSGPSQLRAPRIDGDRIRWSIQTNELTQAWRYLGRCVDRANSASARLALAGDRRHDSVQAPARDD